MVLCLGMVDLEMRHSLAQGQSPEEVSKQDVEVNKFHVLWDDGRVDEAFAINHSDVCCNKAALVQTRTGRG